MGRAVLPKIEAARQAEGFVLTDRSDSWGCVAALAVFALAVNGPLYYFIATGGGVTWLAGLLALLGLIPVAFLLHKTRILLHMAPGELILPRWPLPLGGATRFRFRRRLKRGGMPDRVEARLVLTEVARYRVGTETRTVREKVREDALPEARPAAGSPAVEIEWTLRLPGDGPASFAAPDNRLEWSLEVMLHMTSGPSDDSTFQLLVLPEVVRD